MANKIVSLNALQNATLKAIADSANDKGVIQTETVLGYKLMVVKVLMRHGVLVESGKHYRIAKNVEIVERAPHVHRESTLIKMAERAAAPRNPVGRPRKTLFAVTVN